MWVGFRRSYTLKNVALVDARDAMESKESGLSWVNFRHHCLGGTAENIGSGEVGTDPIYAISQIADDIYTIVELTRTS